MGATSTVATIVGKFCTAGNIASGFVECEPGVLSDSLKPTNNHCCLSVGPVFFVLIETGIWLGVELNWKQVWREV